MKKIWLLIIVVFSFLLLVFIGIVIFSFSFVKKNTDEIIRHERDLVAKLVRIPNAVAPSNPSFESISYVWEMETPQKEVVQVRLLHQTAFTSSQNSMIAILEKPEGADSSVFDKVLPAVISDKKSLDTAFSSDQKSEALGESDIYKSVKIQRDSNLKVVRVIWEIEKDKLSENSKKNFDSLNKIPTGLLGTLYNIQKTVILLFSA